VHRIWREVAKAAHAGWQPSKLGDAMLADGGKRRVGAELLSTSHDLVEEW
jgi:hypothetical protein